ncbi:MULTISPECIES: hypothetical protein [unclassified Corynebacterium]|uniref:hypothetical protein n=1 Tax=unclassified Corynebacterium TaxID=2624378 RepID=UPI0029CA486F|nr:MULTISPECIES: hypothetical protein [unclassified Corynebacterium]WPF66958.1 hypothetical protein OLX12_04325 [Corynebacterium sp. 22KM0430]WPF69446.1 hypothetical protein OLW90_04320 [Corynebacterium sp. 21KM1197]
MSYADFAIKQHERLVDDEFERAMLHKSSTVALAYNDWLCLGSAVILAWILPGYYSLAGLIAIAPITFSRLIGIQWLRRFTPRPRYLAPSKWEIILQVIIFAAIVVGVFHNIGWPKDPFSFILPASGGLLGTYYAYKRSEARREEDRKALDRKLGPDSTED